MTNMRHLRQTCGLSQPDLADRIGVTRNQVSQYETGARWPTAVRLPRIADALGCTIDALYGRKYSTVLEAVSEWEGTETMEELT